MCVWMELCVALLLWYSNDICSACGSGVEVCSLHRLQRQLQGASCSKTRTAVGTPWRMCRSYGCEDQREFFCVVCRETHINRDVVGEGITPHAAQPSYGVDTIKNVAEDTYFQ